MRLLASIGLNAGGNHYVDRPTVKVIIRNDDKILLLNNGLLPGGGVDKDETLKQAITRELQEELGVSVSNIKEIGLVEQFRPFLEKRYLVYRYTAELVEFSDSTNPQDDGEVNFTLHWLTLENALHLITDSINEMKASVTNFSSDATQGKLYNLMASYELVTRLKINS